jgi:hypothetical protein
MAAAHVAMRSDATGSAQRFTLLERRSDLSYRTRNLEPGAERFNVTPPQCIQFGATLRDQIILGFVHWVADFKLKRRIEQCLVKLRSTLIRPPRPESLARANPAILLPLLLILIILQIREFDHE